jgi:hypothetical protein
MSQGTDWKRADQGAGPYGGPESAWRGSVGVSAAALAARPVVVVVKCECCEKCERRPPVARRGE